MVDPGRPAYLVIDGPDLGVIRINLSRDELRPGFRLRRHSELFSGVDELFVDGDAENAKDWTRNDQSLDQKSLHFSPTQPVTIFAQAYILTFVGTAHFAQPSECTLLSGDSALCGN